MMKNLMLFLFPVMTLLIFFTEENHAPVVKIISPKSNTSYTNNSTVQYSISVSDKEDGDSKFSEIAANEVFLEVNYYNDSAKLNADIKKTATNDAPGLATIKTSNCFNCHGFNGTVL